MTTQQVNCAVGSVARRFVDEVHHEGRKAPFRHRELDGELGRWKTADPLGYVDGMSRYEFVGSTPGSLVDPQGLTKVDFGVDVRFAGIFNVPFRANNPAQMEAALNRIRDGNRGNFAWTAVSRQRSVVMAQFVIENDQCLCPDGLPASRVILTDIHAGVEWETSIHIPHWLNMGGPNRALRAWWMEQQRVWLAHEAGHVVLTEMVGRLFSYTVDINPVDFVTCERNPGRLEKEAEVVAARLLRPTASAAVWVDDMVQDMYHWFVR